MRQDKLREQCRLVKALDKRTSYKDIAGVIDLSYHSFINWLHGYYNLSYNKEKQLDRWVSDMLYP